MAQFCVLAQRTTRPWVSCWSVEGVYVRSRSEHAGWRSTAFERAEVSE
jgi:hypothetical protein